MATADSSLLSPVTQMVERSATWLSSSPNRSSIENHLERLRRMVPRIQAVLNDAEEREIREEFVKLWLQEIKYVAYEADDVLDVYEYELLRAEVEAAGLPRELRQVRHLNTVSLVDDLFWDRIASRIQEITDRFDEISKQREALGLREGFEERRHGSTWVRRPSSSPYVVSNIYGREDDINELMGRVISPGGNDLSVICVVGMGGVGKTTLVQHVFNDQAVCEHFELRGWVCVSDEHEVDKLTKRIIEGFTKEQCDLRELSVLHSTLINELSGKRFLLVLDDLWNQDPTFWDCLQAPLKYGLPGSAIIITTRIETVARITQAKPFLRLECLSFDDCWAIFRRHAFHGQFPNYSQDLLEVGKEIVRKCGGLPLASTTLGGLLQYESDIDKWNEILRSDIWDPDENSGNKILPTLMLSYIHLPTYLKCCFAYCSVFPKDFSFTKQQVVRLWMAQGFIKFHRVRKLEETGVQYFDELLQRSLFQPTHEYSPEHEDRFVMHDLIHDLALYVSGRECSIIKKDELSSLCHENHLLRHITVVPHSNDVSMIIQLLCCEGLKGLRSLLHLRTDLFVREDVVTEIPDAVMQALGSLRALDLSYIHIKNLPDSIGNLKHLRYLDLCRTRIEVLPESVCQLYHLQTMDLSYAKINELPDSIVNLKELRYVNLSHTGVRLLPESVGELLNLHTLDLGYTGISKLPRAIGHLRQLTHLDLSGTQITSIPHTVCMLRNLRTLTLNNVSIDQLPDSIGELRNLRYLHVNETLIKTLPESIGKLHQLQMLNLSFSRIKELPESIGNLGRLRHLDLSSTDVARVPASICRIYNLQSLLLKSCSSLESLPDDIGRLTNLQHLDFNSFSTSGVYIPRGIGRLTNLQALPILNVGEDSRGCGVEELMDLTELRGRLEISGLCHVTNPECAKMANLRGKSHIDKLALSWGGSSGEMASEAEQTSVLAELLPHTGLTELTVRGYGGIGFPRWMGDASFSRLFYVVLDQCTNCTYLPALGQLPSLKMLTIRDVSSVEFVGHEFRGGNGVSRAGFPSLEVLTVRDMDKWVVWEGVERGDFPRLAQLEVYNCPNLRRDLPNSSYPLPMLRVLKLALCQSLVYVPLHNLPKLETARLEQCEKLAHIDFGNLLCSSSSPSSSSSSNLTAMPAQNSALRSLWIVDCPLAVFSRTVRRNPFSRTERSLLPSKLTYLYIDSGSRNLLKWCRGDGRSWLAQIPNTGIWSDKGGNLRVQTSSVPPHSELRRVG
uniref:Putative disease resistance RPP13-like protein 1 n=1 Tax=Anthurium amnicola TaxID=1678845 RepID=A0A1D1XKX3_9ARAE